MGLLAVGGALTTSLKFRCEIKYDGIGDRNAHMYLVTRAYVICDGVYGYICRIDRVETNTNQSRAATTLRYII